MKKILLFLAAALLFASLSIAVFAEEPENLPYITRNGVVFVSNGGHDDFSGMNPAQPKKSFGTLDNGGAIGQVFKGGTVVASGKLIMSSDYPLPKLAGPILITSKYAGVDYRVSTPATNPDCAWKMGEGAFMTVHSDVIVDNIIFFQQYTTPSGIIVEDGATLVIGKNVKNMVASTDCVAKIIVNEGGRLIVGGGSFVIENNGGEVIEDFTYDYLKVTQTAPADVDRNADFFRRVIYVAYNEGYDGNQGTSISAPKKTLGDLNAGGAISALRGGGKLVALGRVYFADTYTIPKLGGYLTITGEHDGNSYINLQPADNPSGGVIKIADGKTLYIGTDTRIENILFFQEGAKQVIVRITNGATVTIGENVTCKSKTSIIPRLHVDAGATLILENPEHSFSRISGTGTVITLNTDEISNRLTVSTESAAVWAGQEVTVALDLTENFGFNKLDFTVEFDNTELTLLSIDTFDADADFTVSSVDSANESGEITFSRESLANLAGNGNVAYLTFKSNDSTVDKLTRISASGTASLGKNLGSEAVAVYSEDGEISINGYIAGDVDNDKQITLLDVALMLKYATNWDVEMNVLAADVDGNGVINIRDTALIVQYLADWDVELKK